MHCVTTITELPNNHRVCEPAYTPAATQHRKATLGALPPSELQRADGLIVAP